MPDYSSLDPLSPGRFIRELYGISPENDLVEFTFIQKRPTPEDPDAKRMRWIFHTVGQVIKSYEEIAKELEKHNRTQVENVYLGLHPRARKPRKRGKNSDVDNYVTLWGDIDWHQGNETGIRKVFKECREILEEMGLAPSVVIESGYGLHPYWLLDKPYPKDEARPRCAGLMDALKISDAIHDPSRLLRVPGFLNLRHPKEPKWCKIVEATYKRYPLSAFDELSIDPGKSKEDKEDEQLRKDTPVTMSRDPEIEKLKDGVSEGGGSKGGRHNAAVSLAGHYSSKMKSRKIVAYALHDWNQKNDPPLPDNEIDTIVDDIWAKEQVRRADSPGKREAKREEKKQKRLSQPWFDDDGAFIPALMELHLLKENRFFSTPIAQDGRGVTLYMYENGVYIPDGASFVRARTKRLLAAAAKMQRVDEVTQMVIETTKRKFETINPEALNLINLKNGMLDWRTGKLHPHDPKHLSTIQIGAEWDPDVKSSELDEFMGQLFPPDVIPLVEEFVGHLLIPDTSPEKAFIAVGSGGNGKSTFLKIIRMFIGPPNVSNVSLHRLVGKDRFFVYQLFGKLVNIYNDLATSMLEATDIFKLVTSGDPVLAEKKFQDAFSFVPFARLVFSANQFPRSSDRSEAFADRLLFVPFPNRFRGGGRQIHDYDKILINTPGFMTALLNHAVSGLQRLKKNHNRFTVPAICRDMLENYRLECDSAYAFVKESCDFVSSGWIRKTTLYKSYTSWCEDSRLKALGRRHFHKTVSEISLSLKITTRDGYEGWEGLRWKNKLPEVSEKNAWEVGGSKNPSPENDF